jgi:hypothetical protein
MSREPTKLEGRLWRYPKRQVVVSQGVIRPVFFQAR